MLCLNVLEYLDDPEAVVESLGGAPLKPGGILIVAGAATAAVCLAAWTAAWATSAASASRRRGTCWRRKAFRWRQLYQFNKAGAPPWWAYSQMLGSRKINKPVLKLFDKTVWIWSRFDGLIPWPGLSLIIVARAGGPPAGRG